MEYAIQTENLVKKFDKGFTALDGISLQIKQGEIVGYAGPRRLRKDHYHQDTGWHAQAYFGTCLCERH